RRLKFIVRAFNIADRDDCVMVSADEDELFKQHCHTVDRIVTALCQAVDSKLDFDCPCGSLTSALLSICSHHIGFRCCQNAVAKYAATKLFWQRALKQAAIDGQPKLVERYHSKLAVGQRRNEFCQGLIADLALHGNTAALQALAATISDDLKRDLCCSKSAAKAARAGRFEAAVQLLLCIAKSSGTHSYISIRRASNLMNPVKRRFFEKLLLIAEQRGRTEEFLRLVKHLNGTSNEQICLKYLAEAVFFSGRLHLLPSLVADSPNQGVKIRVLGLLLNESDAVTEQHIAIGLKILPRIESPANRWRFCLEAAERVAKLGRSNLLEELIKLLPPPLPDDQLLERRITPKQKLLILVAETAATGGDLRTAAWAAGTADCAAMEDQCLDRARLAAQARHQLSVAVSLTRLIKDDGARNGTTNHGIYLADNSTKNLYLLKFLAETVAIGEDYYVKKILLNANQHQLHQLLCSSLSHGHSALATAILPSIQDVNKRLDDQLCSTTLMLAAELGHCHVIAKLLERGADREVRDTQGCTALDRARLCGRNQATWVLAEEGNVKLTSPASTGDIDLHDSQLSEKLHWVLTSSGFTQSRAACQQRLADLLERTAACLSLSKPHLIGSFADGWGCSLTRLNARLSDGSGIDWLTPVTAAAGCPGATKLRLDFTGDPPDKEEGAQLLTVEDDASGFGQQPPVASAPCGLRPATSTTLAFRSPQSASALLLPLVSIRDAALIHLQQTFAIEEKQRMRQLNTVQGQLFILLKFLLKNYLAEVSQCPGLTSHHVKHLLFYLIETHGSWNWQMWQPHKLIELAKEALDLMMKFLDSTSSSDDGCMPSFFKPHVQLQLQWTRRPADEAKTRIRAELLKARSDLEPAVKKLMSHLKPLDDDDKLYFDLFTLLPLTLPPDVPHDRKSQAPDATELAGLYCSVAAALRALQAADEVDGEGALMRQLESWYECSWCHCTVRCLAVMAQLKYRNKTAAKETLSELVMSSGWTVEDLSKEAISETQSWRWPLSTDWAWRFCLPCDRRPSLPFLPRFTESLLTARLCSRSPMQRHLYVNFRCLSWSLQAELLGGRRAACIRADGAAGSGFAKRLAQQWFLELQAESAGSQLDTEELATLAHYTDSPVQLRFCLERMEAVVAREPRVAMDSCDNERLERVRRKLDSFDRCFLAFS
uniref:ANK_REP_REGION domain-containing protein n=1 Tax=Macrostomum lignano TaxID=282301 RepID=A0A1I8H6N7_9PLAT